MTPNSETRPLRHSGVGWFAESHTAGDRGAKSSPRGLCEAAMGRARADPPRNSHQRAPGPGVGCGAGPEDPGV